MPVMPVWMGISWIMNQYVLHVLYPVKAAILNWTVWPVSMGMCSSITPVWSTALQTLSSSMEDVKPALQTVRDAVMLIPAWDVMLDFPC